MSHGHILFGNKLKETEDEIKSYWQSVLDSYGVAGWGEEDTATAMAIKNTIKNQLSFVGIKAVPGKANRLALNKITVGDLLKFSHRLARLQYARIYTAAIGGIITQIQGLVSYGTSGVSTDVTASMTPLIKEYINTLIEIEEDKALQEVIVSQFGSQFVNVSEPEDTYSFISPRQDSVDSVRLRRFVLKWLHLAEQGKILSPAEFFNEVVKYPVLYLEFLATNAVLNHLGGISFTRVAYNSFPVMVGGLPIPHCLEIEIVRSGMIIKFRATGAIFLAQQDGGEDAIRIECMFVGEEAVLVIILWMLFLYGRGEVKEIGSLKDMGMAELVALKDKLVTRGTINADMQKPTYEHHNTFPFISRHFIIPNTYIETLSFEDRIIDGRDTLKVSILMRTYRKPFQFVQHTIDEEKNLVIVAQKTGTRTVMYKLCEFFGNVAWRTIMSSGIVIQEQSWRAGTDFVSAKSSGREDVYYEVTPRDVAMNVALGVIGVGL